MSQATELLAASIVYIYLFYGLAFMVLASVVALQARAPLTVLPRYSLWLLASFGLLHGAHEWVEMAVLIQAGTLASGNFALLQFGNLLLVAISFAFLMQFAIELLISMKRWPKWSRGVPGGLVLIWVSVLVIVAQLSVNVYDAEWLLTANALARYVLGFPSSLLAAYALLVATREPREIGAGRIEAYLTGGAMAFVAYAFFTGLVVPPAPFFPASLINTETFLAVAHMPVEVFRGICAITIAGLLSEAFVVEAARTQTELERLREEFISIVAHDLRSPITTINLSADLLDNLQSEGLASERERAMLKNIRASAKSLSRMVEDLLDASRIEAKRLALQKEKVDLRRLIHEVVDRAAMVTKGHEVRVVVPDALPLVDADPARVEQILVNLLSNAAKYSYPDTEILVQLEARPTEVVVSVTNYGPGIAPEEQRRLFARFYRAKAAERGKIPGLGLGLYIAKGLAEAQGGRMWVESESGRYATFRFTLPRAPK